MGDSTGPVMMYEVKAETFDCKFSCGGASTVWQIGGHKWTEAFKCPGDALAQLQREIDSDTAGARFWSSSSLPSG